MLKKKNKSIKILILVTAYNVENFLESVLNRLPKSIEKYNIEMPIANSVYGILFEDKNPLEAVKELMTRNLTAEKR